MPLDDLLEEFTQLTDLVKAYTEPINGVVLYFHSIRSFVAYGRGSLIALDRNYSQYTEDTTAENFVRIMRERYPSVDMENALQGANTQLHKALTKELNIQQA